MLTLNLLPKVVSHSGSRRLLGFIVRSDRRLVEGQPPLDPADLRRYVVHQVVNSVRFTGAIWVIFLADRGLSIGQIGLAEACFHLAPLTLELPTGSIADIVGRKWSLAIGSLLGVASSLLMLAVDDVWLALVAMYLAGAAFTFVNGKPTSVTVTSVTTSCLRRKNEGPAVTCTLSRSLSGTM